MMIEKDKVLKLSLIVVEIRFIFFVISTTEIYESYYIVKDFKITAGP